MRLAWFRAFAPDPDTLLDDTAAALTAIARHHQVEVVTAATAHRFVIDHARRPYDLCIYEPGPGEGEQFIWPYLFHYAGVLVLRVPSLHDGRAATLERQQRPGDYAAEFAFNHGHAPRLLEPRLPRGYWPMLRALLLASRTTAVFDATLHRQLIDEYPDADIRVLPLGVETPAASPARPPAAATAATPVTFAVFGHGRRPVVERAVRRARAAGANVALVDAAASAATLDACDAVLALTWPSAGEAILPALAGMARARPVVVFEMDATADWPALDPQTWRPRGHEDTRSPIAVSIDPRDEEHAIVQVMRRLAADVTLRQTLGAAAQAWWRAHHQLDDAIAAWETLLADAATLAAPPHPPAWPAHLDADGTAAIEEALRGCVALRFDMRSAMFKA